MEPRPQSPRSAHDQPPSRQTPGGSGRESQETGAYQQQPDPTTVMAPPRSDYDYSPLDLAPPGQRRRRQLVAAGLGGLVMLLLVAAVIFVYLVISEDDPNDETTGGIAAAQTEVAVSEATLAAQQTLVAEAVGDNETPEGESAAGDDDATAASAGENGGDPDGTTTVDEGGDEAADAPSDSSLTDVVGQIAGGSNGGGGGSAPTEDELTALLPSQNIMPQGLDDVAETSRTEDEVAAAIGGNREAETNLQEWGWSGNVERSFTALDPASLAPDATTQIIVSIHGFSGDAAAAEALTFYSDVVAASGFEEVEAGDVGDSNRLLVQPTEEGGTNVAFYVQQGPVLYRIGGYSPGGDPTTNVVNVAEEMLGGQ